MPSRPLPSDITGTALQGKTVAVPEKLKRNNGVRDEEETDYW